MTINRFSRVKSPVVAAKGGEVEFVVSFNSNSMTENDRERGMMFKFFAEVARTHSCSPCPA
jgi:hypothetical protein